MFIAMGIIFTSALFMSVIGCDVPPIRIGDRSEIYVCSESAVRVTHRPTASAVLKRSLVVKPEHKPVDFSTHRDGDAIVVRTAKLVVRAERGSVKFASTGSDRDILLSEGPRTFSAVTDGPRDTYQVEQSWLSSQSEGLYGGGAYQNGLVNYKGAPLQMVQFNTEAVVPFFLSTKGYGLLWDNYAWTFLNPPEQELVHPSSGAREGTATFVAKADGEHYFYVGRPFPASGEAPSWGSDLGSGNVSVMLIDESGIGNVAVEAVGWSELANAPASFTGRVVGLKKGVKYTVRYSWGKLDSAGLYLRGAEARHETKLRSALGDLIDYYFIFDGGALDGAIAGYRDLSGVAPLYGRWVFGFWQCKEHYATQAELLGAAHGFRNRSIPVDAIVQDWHYWGNLGWGPQWDKTIYPDPAGMVKELHSLDLRLMVSVWSKFDKKTAFYEDMKSIGAILGDSIYYDAWNPEARRHFYQFANASLFSLGVESLWLDATEPEFFPNVNVTTFLGSGNAYMNSYSLMTTSAIADGLRRDYAHAQGARVFSLTRSSFAGQQRTGAALWSGDTSGTWDSLRRQIASSINFALSGMPYWSQDIGGFFRPSDQYTSSDYHELLTRWFQFGAFVPIFRVHGAGTATELWNFGDTTMSHINASAVSLRYRLLPYTYSGFARVEQEGYTMQRGLVMDFPEDPKVQNIADEFMWGDAFLVTPLYSPGGNRHAYFPGRMRPWVNFHTGEVQTTGDASVSFGIDEAPVFVRAGSIVVLGPFLQHTAERSADPLEVRVYRGADASFTLYEDDGVSQDYRHGGSATISFRWYDDVGQLVIGARDGHFSSMLKKRTFNVVWVTSGHGVGVRPADQWDAVVVYDGNAVVVGPTLLV